jgi:hypothetical protein
MSAVARNAIADAANMVSGIFVMPYWSVTSEPGTGCVYRLRSDYLDSYDGLDTWHVIVTLPNGDAAADEWLDEWVTPLVAAVRTELSVRNWTRMRMNPDAGNVPVVVIEGQREEGA